MCNNIIRQLFITINIEFQSFFDYLKFNFRNSDGYDTYYLKYDINNISKLTIPSIIKNFNTTIRFSLNDKTTNVHRYVEIDLKDIYDFDIREHFQPIYLINVTLQIHNYESKV